MFRRREEDELQWRCKFCRVGVGNTHSCTAIVTPTHLVVRWWTGPIERERKFHARNILRASAIEKGPSQPRVTVHVLTSPDGNGESEYKQYDMTAFHAADGLDTFTAAVNAIAFTVRPLFGRCLIFVNPVSGARQGPQRFKLVRNLFLLVGLEADVITTTHHGHASEIVTASDLTKYAAIISISGDGTLNEIFTALIARPDAAKAVQIPIGIIPAGSEGTLAKMCTLFDPFAAAWVILKCHEVRPLDVLEISQDNLVMYSQCGIGWGIPGKVAEESEALRSAYGRSRYAVSAINQLINLKGARGTLEVLPARERPLYVSGRSAEECEDLGGRSDTVAVTLGACRECGGVFTCSIEGVPQPCPKCGGLFHTKLREDSIPAFREDGLRQEPEQEGAHALPSANGDTEGAAARPPLSAMSISSAEHYGQARYFGNRLTMTPRGGVLAVLRESSRTPGTSPVGRGDYGHSTNDSVHTTPDATGGDVRSVQFVVPIDYQRRLDGLGDAADRGSALLQVSQQWREEVESSPEAEGCDIIGAAAGKRQAFGGGPWQRLEGQFLAIGALNTEKISAPFAHMSDGCMDVIALPAAVGAVGLIQMGAKLSSGEHVRDRRIFHWKAVAMRFTPENENDKFNIDGEVLDGLPIEARVLPSLCRLISLSPVAAE